MDIAVGDTILTRKQHPVRSSKLRGAAGGHGFQDPLHGLWPRGHAAPGEDREEHRKRSSNRARNSPAAQHIQKLFCKENCLICRI